MQKRWHTSWHLDQAHPRLEATNISARHMVCRSSRSESPRNRFECLMCSKWSRLTCRNRFIKGWPAFAIKLLSASFAFHTCRKEVQQQACHSWFNECTLGFFCAWLKEMWCYKYRIKLVFIRGFGPSSEATDVNFSAHTKWQPSGFLSMPLTSHRHQRSRKCAGMHHRVWCLKHKLSLHCCKRPHCPIWLAFHLNA